jgi:hypothetical protein
MTQETEDPIEDIPAASRPPSNGELVHWMEPKPMSLGAAGISAATFGAFVAGAATAVAVLALMHWLEPKPMRRP